MAERKRFGGWPVALALAFAGLWSLGLVVAVGSVPMISATTTSTDGFTTSTTTSSSTLVEEIGSGAYAMAGAPLVAAILVAGLSILRSRTWPLVVAAVVVGVLGLVNLLAMLTIGILFVPATGALVVATCLMGAGRAGGVPGQPSHSA